MYWSRYPRQGAPYAEGSATHVGAIQIVDLYHAREQLADLGKILYGPASREARTWLAARCKQLEREEVEALLAVQRWLRPREETIVEVVRKAIGYFRTNAERVRYACFRRQGLFVGSGVVEAGCKTIVRLGLGQSVCAGQPETPIPSLPCPAPTQWRVGGVLGGSCRRLELGITNLSYTFFVFRLTSVSAFCYKIGMGSFQ